MAWKKEIATFSVYGILIVYICYPILRKRRCLVFVHLLFFTFLGLLLFPAIPQGLPFQLSYFKTPALSLIWSSWWPFYSILRFIVLILCKQSTNKKVQTMYKQVQTKCKQSSSKFKQSATEYKQITYKVQTKFKQNTNKVQTRYKQSIDNKSTDN